MSPASHGCRSRSVSAAATTMQPMAMRYGACTRLTSVRYESFSTALPRLAHSFASEACNVQGPMSWQRCAAKSASTHPAEVLCSSLHSARTLQFRKQSSCRGVVLFSALCQDLLALPAVLQNG